MWAKLSGTNVWRERWVLFTEDGDRVLTLLFVPKSRALDASCALMEIENEWLYHGIGVDKVLELLRKCVHFEILGVSRYDLCCDFEPSRRQHDIIKGLASGKYYLGGKRNGSLFWSQITDEKLSEMWRSGKVPHCQSWGHKTTAVKWKLYYKSKELRDAMGCKGWAKPYIIDRWREHGLDIGNVWRLEVSIHGCNGYEFQGKRLSFEVLRQFPDDVFKSLYNDRFQVRVNQGHKDKTNDERVEFLPIDVVGKLVKGRKHEALAERSGRVTLLRHLVSDLDLPAVVCDDTTRENTLWMIQQLVERDRLQEYFVLMTGVGIDDFVEDARLKSISLQSVVSG